MEAICRRPTPRWIRFPNSQMAISNYLLTAMFEMVGTKLTYKVGALVVKSFKHAWVFALRVIYFDSLIRYS